MDHALTVWNADHYYMVENCLSMRSELRHEESETRIVIEKGQTNIG